jgi:DNA polymerase-3 subunit chi
MQVDFYQLSRDPVHLVVPAIAGRVLEQGGRLLIVDGREDARARISSALWAAQPASFLAHGRAGGEGEKHQPILLSGTVQAGNAARHVALTDGLWRDEALDYDRSFYFFDDATVTDARGHWRRLKGLEGGSLRFWRQEGRRWVQAG